MNRKGYPGDAGFPYMGPAPMYPAYQAPVTAGYPTAAMGGAMMPSAFAPIGGPIPGAAVPGVQPPVVEESYIENILRLNLGKMATVYMTFENNSQWNAKVFKGRLEAAGRDHIIISDPQTGIRYLLLMVNLDYITFDEELNYQYPFA
jgi:spore germination protein Q